jgi:hypothetical protein
MKRIIITTLTLLLLINLALAQSGCFLYSDSPAHCSDLSIEEAEIECFFYDDCVLEESFFPEEGCNDEELFTECKTIFCKDTCTNQLLSQCKSGAVPAGEEELWCVKGGCCQFADYCQYKSSKSLCEIEATNNQFQKFTFTESSEKECLESCAQPQVIDVIKETNITEENITQDDSNKVFFWLFLLMFSIIVIMIIHHFYHFQYFKKNFWNKVKHLFTKKEETTKTKEDLQWYSPLFSTPLSRKKIKLLKQKREHKIKERNREDFLAAVGLIPKKITKDEFSKLKNVVSAHQRKNKYHPEPKKEYFHNLEQVVDKIKEREENFREKLTHPQEFKEKKDVDELIKRLRKIAK